MQRSDPLGSAQAVQGASSGCLVRVLSGWNIVGRRPAPAWWTVEPAWLLPTFIRRALGESECVFDIDAKVASCAFDLSVTQQDLDHSEIVGSLVDDRRLCPPQPTSGLIRPAKASASHSFVDQPSILSRAKIVHTVVPGSRRHSRREYRRSAPTTPGCWSAPSRAARTGRLHHCGSGPDATAAEKIAGPNPDDVATPQLAVDGEIEEGPIPQPFPQFEPVSYGPYLLWLQRPFGAYHSPSIPRLLIHSGSKHYETQACPLPEGCKLPNAKGG